MDNGQLQLRVDSILTCPLQENTFGYYEVNPIVTLHLPQGIKMLVGTFDNWFGTADGTALRAWCLQQGWPLAWAHNPIDSTFLCDPDPTKGCHLPPAWDLSHGVEQANIRLLDPEVLVSVAAGHNSTDGADFAAARAAFATAWDHVAATVPANATVVQRRAVLDPLWISVVFGEPALGNSTLAVEPLYPGACANRECVGVQVRDGHCVCAYA